MATEERTQCGGQWPYAEGTRDDISATLSRCLAIGEFRVMGEVISDEEAKHGDRQ